MEAAECVINIATWIGQVVRMPNDFQLVSLSSLVFGDFPFVF